MTVTTGQDVLGSLTGALSAMLVLGVLFPLVFWLVDALVVGWLAEQKGRSIVWWLLAGLVVGPIALLALGFAPRGTAGRYGPCPHCLEAVDLRARRCPLCREVLDGPESTEENPYLGH